MKTREPAEIDMDGAEARRRRKLQGVTVDDLAQRCGVTPAHIRHLENGIRNPSPPVFAKICDALGVSVENRSELLVGKAAS